MNAYEKALAELERYYATMPDTSLPEYSAWLDGYDTRWKAMDAARPAIDDPKRNRSDADPAARDLEPHQAPEKPESVPVAPELISTAVDEAADIRAEQVAPDSPGLPSRRTQLAVGAVLIREPGRDEVIEIHRHWWGHLDKLAEQVDDPKYREIIRAAWLLRAGRTAR